MRETKWIGRALAATVLLAVASPAGAQSAAEPFAGKSVSLIIGFGPGGGYDLWGRTVARHIGRHLPGNPTVVPQNMPGAGSYVAASHIYGAAPKDGTVFAIIARDAALGPLSNAPGARFDATKMSWLGSPTREHNVCIANANAAVLRELRDGLAGLAEWNASTIEKLFGEICERHQIGLGKLAQPVRVALTGGTASPGIFDVVFEKRMGWKFTAEDRRVFHINVSAKRSP